MSLVGKIFIVMILIMSCVFMGLTIMVYATHTNWKDRAEKLEQERQAARQQVSQLEAQREKTLNLLALERASRAEALAALEVRSRELDQQLVRAERDRQQLQADNAEKIKLTGSKLDQRTYFSHSGHPGAGKHVTVRAMMEKRPHEVVRRAVRGMLPKNKLGRKMLKKLRVYAGPDHPHQAQSPEPLEL